MTDLVKKWLDQRVVMTPAPDGYVAHVDETSATPVAIVQVPTKDGLCEVHIRPEALVKSAAPALFEPGSLRLIQFDMDIADGAVVVRDTLRDRIVYSMPVQYADITDFEREALARLLELAKPPEVHVLTNLEGAVVAVFAARPTPAQCDAAYCDFAGDAPEGSSAHACRLTTHKMHPGSP